MRTYTCLLASALVGALLTGCGKTSSTTSAPNNSYTIYVTNEKSGDMTIIDSNTMEPTATVPLGKRPRGIKSSLDGKTIYVALSGSPIAGPDVDESTLPPPDKSADGLGVFDIASKKITRIIKSGSDPENFDLSKDGKQIYVSNEDASGLSVLDIDSGKMLATIATGEEPEGVRTTPDGKYVYVTSEASGTVGIVDTTGPKLIKTLKVGRRPRSVAFLPDGTKAYATTENDGAITLIDAVKMEVVNPIPLGKPGVIKPMATLMSKDGSELYISSGRGKQVFIIDTATNTVKGAVEVGPRPWGIALSPDGKTLFSANGPSNDISVVDLATRTVKKKIKAGESPWGVITVPR